MATLVGIIVGLLVLVLLVVVHELGHAIVARRNGVIVEEFGVGFPPLAWGRKIKRSFLGKNVLYSVNWLPIGGFVRLKGEFDSANEKGDYGAATYWVKTKILLAGVLMNWAVAAVLFTILALTGLPKILDNQFSVASDTRISTLGNAKTTVTGVIPGSPADKAGIKKDDDILKIAGSTLTSPVQLSSLTKQNQGKKVAIEIRRGGVVSTLDAQLNTANNSSAGYLGVSAGGTAARETIHATWSAPIVGVATTAQLTGVTFQGLGDMVVKLGQGIASKFSGDQQTRQAGDASLASVGNNVAGPIGILGVIFPQAEQAGLTSLVFLTAIISLSLAAMNVLPIPALDGGRWFTMTLFKLRKKVLTKEKEETIQATGMLVLLSLVVLITIADIGKVLK